jgi:hypothetical protein
MKKLLLLFSLVLIKQINAQCPISITANPTNICVGQSSVLSASGSTTYTWTPATGLSSTTGANVTANPLTTTTYTVHGNVGACLDSQTVTIYVTQNPTVTVSSSGGNICSGQTATLTATGATTYTWAPGGVTTCCMVVSPSSTTNYTVCGAVSGGCVSCTTIAISVLPAPSVSFTLNPSGPHIWAASPVYTGGTSPYTYSWNWGDGSPNSNVAYPSHTYTTPGWYNICATIVDGNGCTSTFCQNDSVYRMSSNSSMVTVNVINGSSGVDQLTVSNHLNIYPNPVYNNFTIQSVTELGIITIYNSLGEVVLQTKSKNIQEQIDISKLPSGIYTIQAQGRFSKLIKE